MKLTLGKVFDQLRNERHATQAGIASACNFSESCVWKLSHDWPTRWETVHVALTVGLHIAPGTEPYETCHLLWLKQRQERAESQPEKFAAKAMTKHAVEATRKFRILIKDLDPESAKKVLAAATRAARSL